VGIGIGQLGSWGIREALPDLEAYPPVWAGVASFIVAVTTGAVFSLLPARTASKLDPVMALSRR
jgi:putative ABC transport system permease protein